MPLGDPETLAQGLADVRGPALRMPAQSPRFQSTSLMLIHPQFDPVAVAIGPVAVHWYGLMYLLGFIAFWLLGRRRAKDAWRGVSEEDVESMLFWGVLGVILGGRLGYCLFYQPDFYLAHPLRILETWNGGMSAHGGLAGVLVVMAVFGRAKGAGFWRVADFVAPLVPLGLFFGRIGNFINGELWGRPASPDLPWAMIFPQAGDATPRHPSQIYEAGLEGLALFALLWIYSRKPRPVARTGALFAIGYGVARILCECFREPDAFLGLQALGLSRGQWLTIPLLAAGVLVWVIAGRRKAGMD